MADKTILLLNPNSSTSVTQILQGKLSSYATPGIHIKFANPPTGPPSINDPITSVLSAAASWKFLEDEGLLNDKSVAGVIVCCFSDHPLVEMLRHHYSHSIYVCHILESSVLSSVESHKPFGILTTGPYWKEPLTEATRRIMPNHVHGLFVGVWCSGVGVLQLGSEEQEHDRQIERCAVEMVEKGAQTIILGCAAMSGMEGTIQKGISDAGLPAVRLVDGTVEGLKFALRRIR